MYKDLSKVLWLICLFLFVSSMAPNMATAQTAFGIRSGLSLSTFRLSIDDSDTANPFQFDYVMGMTLGGHTRFGLGRSFFLQPEFQYARLGGSWLEDESSTEQLTITFRHHCLQVLMLARVHIPYKQFMFNIHVGPHVRYSVGSALFESVLQYEDEYEKYTLKSKQEISWEDVGESFRRFEPGVTAGLGWDMPLGPGRLGADFRFQRGFSSWINPEPGLVYFSSMNFQLGCSYEMVLGQKTM
ncbi:MAG: outer membrane beta-barrel protein [Saprospiraceae bacterium]